MTDKELRRLRRDDLLQILINQQRSLDEYAALVEDYETQLNDRRISVEESGSLAEAALKLNGVFEAAQKAADQYLEETRARAQSLRDEIEKAEREKEDAHRQAGEILEKARAEAERIVSIARREAEALQLQASAPDTQPRPAEPEQPAETRRGGFFRRKKS